MASSAKQTLPRIAEIFRPELDNPEDLNLDGVWALLARYGLSNLAYAGEVGRNPGYIFRGEIEYAWPLRSSLERKLLCKRNGKVSPLDLKKTEREVVTEYLSGEGQRVATMVDGVARSDEETFWWLSLMQHYRQPTRFIDFTRDIRIALFFALEHHKNRQKECQAELQGENLVIYCFPCRDPKYPHDSDHNKTPYGLIDKGIDMNLALGGQIELDWMLKRHGNDFSDNYRNKNRQSWGWDRPYYENPRLRFQKGMFVYPFNAPASDLTSDSESWLVRQLREDAQFKQSKLSPKLLRIPFKHAADLAKILEQYFNLTPAIVYVSPDLVRLHSL